MMNETSSSSKVRTLRLAYRHQRRRLSLILGRRRLMRWRLRLQRMLLSLRQSPQEPRLGPRGSLPLQLGPETLSWALETLEDLYLLLNLLLQQTEQELSRTSTPS